jgi:hypothetical protein
LITCLQVAKKLQNEVLYNSSPSEGNPETPARPANMTIKALMVRPRCLLEKRKQKEIVGNDGKLDSLDRIESISSIVGATKNG